MNKIIRISFISLILALFLAAGCSSEPGEISGETKSVSKKSLDPCALIAQTEIEAAIGAPATITEHDASPRNATGQKLCFYDIASDDAVIYVQIGVQQTADMAAGMTATQLFADIKGFLDDVMTVNDLGDQSYQSQMDFVGGGSLYVLTGNGDTLITIDVSHGKLDHAANQKTERDLAKKILDNLK